MIDSWRTHNLNKRDYTYFSARHNSHSIIDYIFVTGIQQDIESVNIVPKIFSDHAAVRALWRHKVKVVHNRFWRPYITLLADKDDRTRLEASI